MKLTTDNLKKFANLSEMSQRLGNKSTDFLEIDEGAKQYLQESLGLHFDSTNMKRSTTNFDRTVATRQFDQTNKSLKDSHIMRLTQTAGSGFFSTKAKQFTREYNIALRLVREWVK